MKKQNILYVIENPFFGGGERAIAHLINGLPKDNYKVFVACLTDSEEFASGVLIKAIEENAQIIPLDMRNLFNVFNIFRLLKIIKQKKIDLIHSQGARADFYVRMASRFAGKVSLISTVATPVEEYNINPFKKIIYLMIDRFGGRFTDKFIAVAGHIEKKLITNGIGGDKIAIINNGVDIKEYAPNIEIRNSTREKLDISPDVVLIGAVGRLTWEKGLSQFIKAANKIEGNLNLSRANIKYLIAGTGELKESLEKEVDSLGLREKFIFTGFIEQVNNILNAIDILVLPSFREGFPMVLLEAMSVGKAIIASDINGVNESIVNGMNGILIESGDFNLLSDTIVALLSDREKRQKLGLTAKKIVDEKYDIKIFIEKHDHLYEEFLKN